MQVAVHIPKVEYIKKLDFHVKFNVLGDINHFEIPDVNRMDVTDIAVVGLVNYRILNFLKDWSINSNTAIKEGLLNGCWFRSRSYEQNYKSVTTRDILKTQ